MSGKKQKSKSECVVEGCTNDAKTRGLCVQCYVRASTAVKNKTVTWDQLVEFKLAKPSIRESQALTPFSEILARKLGK